jgi:superfamily II DNA/RNA helicase
MGEDQEKRQPNQPMCIIVEPTKELAQQTHAQIQRFGQYLENPKIK